MDRIHASPLRIPFPFQFRQRQQKRENNRKILDFQSICRTFGQPEGYSSVRQDLSGRDVFPYHAQRRVEKKRIKPIISQKQIVYLPLNSFYQVLSAEFYTKHGLNVHGVIFDELHAQPNRALYDVMLHGSGDARKQRLFFLITTAGRIATRYVGKSIPKPRTS